MRDANELLFHTARWPHSDPRHPVLDIRFGGDGIGQIFAPSSKLARFEERMRKALATTHSDRRGELEHWYMLSFEARYRERMRISFRENKDRWQWVLEQPKVILACDCPELQWCHRRHLVPILEKCGAVYVGEVLCAAPQQVPFSGSGSGEASGIPKA